MHCHVSNLEWATHAENVQDGFNRGRKSWNKDMKSTTNMTLEDLARESPRLQELAKALWGEEKICLTCGSTVFTSRDSVCMGCMEPKPAPYWQYHLQQMVIAEDPIKYLGEHMDA